MPFFPNAQNPHIDRSVLIDVAGDFVVGTSSEETGIHLLFQSTATDAAHNSAKRSLPPRCHPETREALLSNIEQRVEGSWNSETRIFWLQGPAGAGKSAIAQTLSEIFDEKQMLAGSFFFTRGKGRRESAQSFVTTLCYRLCLAYPKKRREIGGIVLHDQSILHQTLDVQFQRLIVDPFRRHKTSSTHPYWRSRKFIVIVDGLDECDSEEDQLTILRNVASLMKIHSVPLTFLVTSRPAPHIRECFRDDPIISVIHHELSLEPCTDDVRIFLSSGFSKIREKFSSIPETWPPEDAIKKLVEKSSGYFIYPSTILKFIGDMDSRPTAQLDIVLLGTTNPAFVELDQLYHSILSTVRKPLNLLIQVLGFILVTERSLLPVDVDSLLDLPSGETSLVLHRLHPLLDFAEDGDISFIHGSFPDFLCDRERAGKFFVNLDAHHAAFAQRCLGYMTAYKDGNADSLTPIWLSEYILPYWDIHASQVNDLHHRRTLLHTLDAISLDQWTLIMKLKFSHPFGRILFDNQITRIIHWMESFVIPPQDRIFQLSQLQDMWYRIVVESSPLIKSRSLEHLVIPSPIKNTKHYFRDQLFIRMDSSQGHLERGGAQILPPQVFILTHDKPEEQYYLTSHLNPNTSFIEFLCDQTRSKRLYDSTAAHAYVVKSCLRSFHQRYIRRDLGLYKNVEADGVEDRIIFRFGGALPTKWTDNLLHCSLEDDALMACLDMCFGEKGEKKNIEAILGWIEKELRVAPYPLVPRPVLLFLLKWAGHLGYGSSTSGIWELPSKQDYACTFSLYLARVCVGRFRKYINGWYDDTNRRESKATTVHTQRVQVWIASHGWYNLEPGSVVRDSDQYRSIISFLLSGPSRQNEEGNLGQYFISACSDGRHSLGTEEGGPALLEKYPKCSSWKCSWDNCGRVLADIAEMDGHCLQHFHSFWLSRRSTDLDPAGPIYYQNSEPEDQPFDTKK